MLSLTIFAHRALRRHRESIMRQAVVTFIQGDLCKSSKSLIVRRIIQSEAESGLSPNVPHNYLTQFRNQSLFVSDDIEVLELTPRPTVNLSEWTFYLDSQSAVDEGEKLNFCRNESFFLLVEADEISDVTAFISGHEKWWRTDVNAVKLEGLCRRIAWRIGPPFNVIFACSQNALEQVVNAYMSDLLVTDDPLLIKSMTVINAVGRPVDLIRSDSTSSVSAREPPFSSQPNIILFDAADNDSQSLAVIEENLNRSVDHNAFILYRLSSREWEAGAWRSSTRLLICLIDRLQDRDKVKEQVTELARQCRVAAILLLPPDEELGESEMEDVEEGWTQVELGENACGKLVCLRDIAPLVTESKLRTLLEMMDIESRKEDDKLLTKADETPFFLCTGRDDVISNADRLCDIFKSKGYQVLIDETSPSVKPSLTIIPWSVSKTERECKRSLFRFDHFFSKEEPFKIPIVLFHADVISSSWSIMSEIFGLLPARSGFVITSMKQTAGKGRGSNAWISPLGQLQMTYHCSTKFASPLGQSPSMLQHLAALTLLMAIEETAVEAQCSVDLGIRLKWPNDVYWSHGDSVSKLGGILTRASYKGDQIHFIIGVGLNISNSKPTVCIHDVMLAAGVPASRLPSIELIMRRALICMQSRMIDLENGKLTIEQIRYLYEKRWLHGNQIVHVKQDDDEPLQCRIIGIDSFGYLLVKDTQRCAETFSLHPDGNSFDLLQNLIRPKSN